MFKENSLFNKIWFKLFKRKLIYKNDTFFNQDIKVKYQCLGCKKHHWDIPNMNGERYQWSWDDKFHCELQPSLDNEEIRVYGWVIEIKNLKYNYPWDNYWNKRIYHSKEVAMEAINQISTTGWFKDYDFRIKPLYNIDNQYFRNIKISKLLKK